MYKREVNIKRKQRNNIQYHYWCQRDMWSKANFLRNRIWQFNIFLLLYHHQHFELLFCIWFSLYLSRDMKWNTINYTKHFVRISYGRLSTESFLFFYFNSKARNTKIIDFFFLAYNRRTFVVFFVKVIIMIRGARWKELRITLRNEQKQNEQKKNTTHKTKQNNSRTKIIIKWNIEHKTKIDVMRKANLYFE